MPTPTAPLNSARAVRSIPTMSRAITTARTISTILSVLPISTWTEGVRLVIRLMRDCTSCETAKAAQINSVSSKVASISVSSERWRLPIVRAKLSSVDVSAPRRPRMSTAARNQTITAMVCESAGSRTSAVLARMMIQASSRLAAIWARLAA